MAEKLIVLVILYTAFFMVDFPILKRQLFRERMFYMILLLFTFYLALEYVLGTNWPNLNSLLNLIFGSTVKQIVEYFKASG